MLSLRFHAAIKDFFKKHLKNLTIYSVCIYVVGCKQQALIMKGLFFVLIG